MSVAVSTASELLEEIRRLEEYEAMGIASRRISPPIGEDGDLPVVGLAGQKLAQTIERVVRERIGGKIQGLKVEVRREGVFLQGVCPTFYVKQLAQHAAMQVAGQIAIRNEIKVI